MSVFGETLLVFGPESLVAERAVAARLREAHAENAEAQVNRVEAYELDGNALAEVTGGSLFAEAAVTVVNDLGSTPPELADALLSVALNPPPDLSLVLVHGGGMKGKALLDKLKKAKLASVEAASIKPWEVPAFVSAEAKREKVPLAGDAAQALVDAVGTDLRALVGAIKQLKADTDGGVVDKGAIARYFAGRAEVTSFAVADAAIAGNAPLALERLRWALGTGVASVLVTAAMASGLRGLGKYLDARGSRMSDYDLARDIGVPPFKVKELHRNSRGWTSDGVATAIRAVAVADAQIKGAATDPDYALERMVLAVITSRR